MRRRFVAVTVSAVLSALAPVAVRADLLVPTAFNSLGTFPTASGNYTYDVSPGGVPTISGPGGTIDGTVYQDAPGHSLAVFDFDSINLTAGQTLTAAADNPAQLPLVLLSRGDATIAGTISVSSLGTAGSAGGSGASAGPGAGWTGNTVFYPPSYGPGGVVGGSGGGGFGGAGYGGMTGATGFGGTAAGGFGGASYGDLTKRLVGGSGGGTGASWGGAGGGAIEIGASHTLTVLGQILANGASAIAAGAGGGSGGAILLHGQSVYLSGTLSATGGAGAAGGNLLKGYVYGGGAGGGGRVDLLSDTPGAVYVTGTVRDGNGVMISNAVAPEPSSLALVTIGAVVAAGLGLRNARSGARAKGQVAAAERVTARPCRSDTGPTSS